MKAYKGFVRDEDGTLWCRDFQYEVGKTYTFDGEPILCKIGFHACHKPWQCWRFYPNDGENVYYEVECGGKIVESSTGDGKFVCTEITLVKKIPAPKDKFEWCGNFIKGYAVVELLDGRCNYINKEGKLLSEQWFDYCEALCDGYARVMLNDGWNYIDTKGKLLSKQWWDYCGDFDDFYNGYAMVRLGTKWYKIDKNGNHRSI